MRRYIAIILLLLVALPYGMAQAEENLLQNGGFEEAVDGWPVGWMEDMWLYDEGVTYLELREGGRDGGWCAMVENVARNDARFIQKVTVQPDTTYLLSGWIKVDGTDTGYAGASLSVVGSYAALPDLHDTQGEWVHLESYIRTDKDQKSITIGARLGDYSSDNVGKAYFDDLSLVHVETAPSGAALFYLTDYTNVTNQTQNLAPEASAGSFSIGLGLVALAVLVLALLAMRGRTLPSPQMAIWPLLAVAAAVRLYLMATQPGYETDMACFFSWSARMAEVGPGAFYTPELFCDYPPGYMYLLWATGGLMNLFGVTNLNETGRVIVKLMPMLADLGCVYLLWRIAYKRLGGMPALLLAALYAFSPAILVDGAIWGQVDAVLALGLLGTVALVMAGNWRAALPVFTVTVLMKPQALMAGPIGLIALVMDMRPWKEKGRKVAIDAGIGLALSLGVAVAMLLPFLWGKESPVAWVIDHYMQTLGSYAYATLNTANLYYLIGANWVPLETMLGPLSYGTWGTILMVVVVAGTMGLYIWRGNRERLAFFCALVFIGLYLFGVKMHERYLFPALILLLLAYVARPDWRLLAMFGGFSATFFVNCAIVLRDTHLPLGFGTVGVLLSVANLVLCGIGIWVAVDSKARPLKARSLPPGEKTEAALLASLEGKTPPLPRMRRKDWIAMLSLTLVYAAVAYIGLGSMVAPQTVWNSTGANEQVVLDLGESHAFETMYYQGINQRRHTFTLEFSEDGESWSPPSYGFTDPGDCFRWLYLRQAYLDEATGQPTNWDEHPQVNEGRYVRLSADGPAMVMMEIAFRDVDGTMLTAVVVQSTGGRAESASDPQALVDEPQTMPENPTYYNSTYFDEIYHARTGYEHANQLQTYETTHPPLGKIFIMFGIQLFGMTPFGWRFMGTLAGMLMVPVMYMLGKLLFKRTRFAFLAAFLMAFDMMHLTQTRIATIDSYAVLFILLMYLCMFIYMRMSFFRDGWRTLIPLGLSGLFMGLGCASKWTCIYAGAGLAVLFFWTIVRRFREWRAAERAGEEALARVSGFWRYLCGTLGACLVFFIAIPAAIYYFSYIPYFAWEGGLTLEKFLRAQTSMFSYHANLTDSHAFQSPWYEWPLMLKPMYYFAGTQWAPEGMVSTIMCMGNPAIWWVGLVAFVYMAWRWLRPHLRGEMVTDHRPAMLLLSFAAQFLPWVLVPRSMFIYHYFGSLPFVMLSIVYASERLHAWKPERAQVIQSFYMAVVLVLFVAFYPVATGVPFPRVWADAINWLRFLYLPGWVHRGWIYY